MSLPRSLVLPAALTATAALLAAGPAQATTSALLRGPLAAGGTWTLRGEHTSIQKIKGICLHVSTTAADGSSPGEAVGCAAGSLRLAHNVLPVTGQTRSGATTTGYVLGALTVATGRKVRLTFADGRHATVSTHAAPRGWSTALGARVRYVGADLLGLGHGSTLRRVTVYDRRGHRVGGTGRVTASPLG
jgi:hypothetical protein